VTIGASAEEPGRSCAGCGKPLSRYNTGQRCQGCVSAGRKAESGQSGENSGNLVDGARLAQLRHERGWTQEMLAERSGLSVVIVSKLEQNARRSARVSTLSALARALDVPVGILLGGAPAEEHSGAPARPVHRVRDAEQSRPTLLRALITQRHWQRFGTFEAQFRHAARELAKRDHDPDLAKLTVSSRQWERWYAGSVKTEPHPDACRVLEHMFGYPVQQLLATQFSTSTPTAPARMQQPSVSGQYTLPTLAGDIDIVSATESMRLMMADALTVTMRPDIDYLLDGAQQHATDSVHTPPEQMLRRLVADYGQVRLLLSEKRSLRHQRGLYRVTAQLSSLVADELMVLGKPVYSSSWHNLARRAADEAGDDILRAHVRALAAMLPLYYGDPLATIQLSQQAQAILPGHQHAVRALAPTLEALAQVQLGDKESGRAALETARRSFEALESRQQAESVFGFSERRWRFYESRILSLLDDIPSAIESQQRAIALYPPEVVGDRALLQLDRASCIVRCKEIDAGLRAATNILLGMPPEHRTDIFLRYAWKVASAVPAQFRSQPQVIEYCGMLRDLAAVSA
jgi:transcriptional regulator with XRE-family HTH domain